MRKVIDVSRKDNKLSSYLQKDMKVLIAFFHGVGDLVMFRVVFDQLKKVYPDISFHLGICKGLGQEEIVPDAIQLNADWREKAEETDEFDFYDIVFSCNFPMNEGQQELTKGEWCAEKELGIPIEGCAGHKRVECGVNRLVGVHYNITCLPDACNPSYETAKKIWDEIRSLGMIPFETHFQHVFHNPVNSKFDFVDSTARGCIPRLSTLAGLLNLCYAFVGVVSGNFHLALSILPSNKICLLEKDFKLRSFTKKDVCTVNIKDDYKEGSIKEFLLNIGRS